MRFISDFHIHSHYSIATSKNLIPEHLEYWAKLKGITVVGTGDFTHPGWLNELKEKLGPAEPGLFALRDEYRVNTLHGIAPPEREVRFILTAEISNIYKKNGSVRKVHNLICAPDFNTAEKIQSRLSKIGNITSDGRPILGLDSRNLLEIILQCSEDCFFVPSHIWTPWFSALGAKSGFDSIEECYEDLSVYIHAIETGLSSDPSMNWLCSFLDRFTIISNSDAHSPEKLGREANIFDTELDYSAITGAMKKGDSTFLGTVEFFPQEGKYHYDGHRKCGVRMNPLESLKSKSLCPVCGKKLTTGVLSRVAQLADRDDPVYRENRHPFYSLIPLKELLSEIMGSGVHSKKVEGLYNSLVLKAGSELELLLDLPGDEIKSIGGEMLAEGIRHMRVGEVNIEEGFDGEYGRIRVFSVDELKAFDQEDSLFAPRSSILVNIPFSNQTDGNRYPSTGTSEPIKPVHQKRDYFHFDVHEYKKLKDSLHESTNQQKDRRRNKHEPSEPNPLGGLNTEQQKAVMHSSGPALILAGPGTGKTRVLTHRVAHLILNGADPQSILTVTFTNRAANEMKTRIARMFIDSVLIQNLQISTFHAFGLLIINEQIEKIQRTCPFTILDENDRRDLISQITGGDSGSLSELSAAISHTKNELLPSDDIKDVKLAQILNRYEELLREHNAFDFDDLVSLPVQLLRVFPELLALYREKYRWILIDEYQDINYAQYQLMRMLMPDTDANIFVIGDPDQAIYGFRGANVRFINRFIDDYPHATVYNLKTSYRCSSTILRASQGMMGRTNGKSGFLEGLSSGVRIRIIEQRSDKSEAEIVARTIESMMGGLRFFSMDSRISEGIEDAAINSLSDFAVLCRIKEQMKTMEEAFNNHSIPYQTIGTIPFYQEEPIKSVIDLIKLSSHPENSLLYNKLIRNKLLRKGEPVPRPVDGISVKARAVFAVDTYFGEEKAKNEPLFQRLHDLCEEFGEELGAFFQYTDLGAGADIYREGSEQVTLITLHAAKGLEFQCVFIIGCEDGLIPYSLFENQYTDPEEERRILYVGMTRAQKFLILTHAQKRYLFGREFRLRRSPFIDSIEEELLELSKGEYGRRQRKQDAQLDLF